MRFMMLIKANADSEAGIMPTKDDIDEMMSYNEELTKAGILLALDGLHPSSKGARVANRGGKAEVTDGPFAEANELIAGFWIISVKSKAEAVEWAKRIPLKQEGDGVEVRQIFDMSDFAPETYDAEQVARVGAGLPKA